MELALFDCREVFDVDGINEGHGVGNIEEGKDRDDEVAQMKGERWMKLTGAV